MNITVSEEAYSILTKIAFLISDNNMAKKYPEFRLQQNVDIEKNNLEVACLIDLWEGME